MLMITFVFLECNSSGDWPLVQEHENYSHCIHKQILFLIDKELVIPLEHDFFGCKYSRARSIFLAMGLGEKPIQTDPTRKQSPAQEKTKNIHVL